MVSTLDQLTLAEFITSGGIDRHVRSMRQSYRRRRDQLVAALAQPAPDVRVTGMAAGLQAVVELPRGTERPVLQAAASHGLMVSGLAEFRYEARTPLAVPDRTRWSSVTPPSDSAWPDAGRVVQRDAVDGVHPAVGWYASLTKPDAYVVAEIRCRRSGSSPAWKGLTPSPQM